MRKFDSERGDGWVDVYDEKLMVKLGIHQPAWTAPNFSKTPKEKIALKKAKLQANSLSKCHTIGKPASFPLCTKIIVHLKKNDNYPQQIYSRKLWMYQVENYVNSFTTKKGKPLVDHYVYNGHTYYPGEFPINPYQCNGKKK